MSENWNLEEKDMQAKHIESENQFWLFMQDARMQFAALGLVIDMLEEKELIAFARQKEFVTIEEQLTQKGKIFSQEIIENERAQLVIKKYNDLVHRLQKFESKDELNQIIEESNESLNQFELGLKNS